MLNRIIGFVQRTPLLWLLAPLIGFYAVILSQEWVPTHDSQVLSRMIYILTGHLSAHGEYPLWLPFMSQGIPSHLYHFSQLSPSVHFLTPFISLWKGWNSNTVYQMSLFIDEVIFLGGLFAFAQLIFKRVEASLFVALSLSGSVIASRQPYFNFGNVYYLPLICYLVLSSFQKHQPFRLLLGLLVFLTFAGRGYGVYPSVVTGLAIMVFTILSALTYKSEAALMLKKFGKKEILVLLLCLVPALLSVALEKGDALLSITSPSRDGSGVSSYESFLSYNWSSQLFSFNEMALGIISSAATIEYAGLCIVPFFFIALIFPSNRRVIPILGTALFIFLFWMGSSSFIAPLFYFLPGVSFYRHVGHVGAVLKIFVVLTAGFGVESLVDMVKSKSPKDSRPLLWVSFGLFVALFLWELKLFGQLNTGTSTEKLRIVSLSVILILHLNLLLVGSLRRFFVPLLLLGALADVYSFRFSLYHQELLHVPKALWSLFQVKPFQFKERRVLDYYEEPNFQTFAPYAESENSFSRASLRSCLANGTNCMTPRGPGIGELYDDLEQFLGMDPCFSIFRAEISMPRVHEVNKGFGLSTALHNPISQFANPATLKQIQSAGYRQVVGCERPKLQLKNRLIVTKNTNEMFTHSKLASRDHLFAEHGDLLKYNISKSALREKNSPQANSVVAPEGVQVTGFNFNRVEMEVGASVKNASTWLYYADAWHPSWRAFVDGVEVPILIANQAYKAIEVPRGKHQVVFEFRSPLALWVLRLNSWMCLFAVSFTLGWMAFGNRLEGLIAKLLTVKRPPFKFHKRADQAT